MTDTPRLPPYVHRCIIPDGDLAGNTFAHDVEPYEVEIGERCPICDEAFASPEAIVAYIYGELM